MITGTSSGNFGTNGGQFDSSIPQGEEKMMDSGMVARKPTKEECSEVEHILVKRLGRFDGDNVQLWNNYVGNFERLIANNGWDCFEEEYLIDFLVYRLDGNARKTYENWTLEDPSVMSTYLKIKDQFPRRFGIIDSVWTRMTDYQLTKMKDGESIEAFNVRFQILSQSISSEEKEVIKYFHSLSREAIDTLSKCSGEWPTTLEGISQLASEMLARNRINNIASKSAGVITYKTVAATSKPSQETGKVNTCYICGEKGHISFYCPKKQIQNNNIKENNANYSPVYVYLTLLTTENKESCNALVDSGASSNCISQELARRLNVFNVRLKKPRKMTMAMKGNDISVKWKTELINMEIGDHEEMIEFFVIPNLQEDVILGKQWLSRHNPIIDWRKDELKFGRCDCRNKSNDVDIKLDNEGKKKHSVDLNKKTEESSGDGNEKEVDAEEVALTILLDLSRAEERVAEEIEYFDDFNNDLEFESDEEIIDSEMIEFESLARLVELVEDESTEIVSELLEDEVCREATIPNDYVNFNSVFSKDLAERLPPLDLKYQCEIDFKENTILPKPRKPFSLSLPERKALSEFIEDNLNKGFIRKSKSPIAMGTFMVGKKNGEYRTVVDFRPVNEIVLDNRNPIPCIDDLMSSLCESKIFTKIDLRGAYNLLRIRPGDEWKTAFVCPQGQFEYMVMPFGLKTAPAIFQSMMEDIFCDLLGRIVLIYLDDILIFSHSEEEHVNHVKDVLSRLQANRLLAKLEKCVFHTKCVDFLGYVISDKGVSIAQDKVEAIMDWPKPLKRRDLKAFLGTANFNRKFVANYSAIVAPLLALDSKEVKDFSKAWNSDCDAAFEALKLAMSSTPVLKHVNFNLPFIVETDASDYALGAVLLQQENLESSIFHPVAYASRKLVPAERNYAVYDKELLGLVFAFRKWHQYLYGARFPIQVRTDHANLQYFQTRQLLNSRHLRWKLFFQNYDFRLKYFPGSSNVVADALSRRGDLFGEENDTSMKERREDTVLDEECWSDLNIIRERNERELVLDGDRRIEIIKMRHSNLTAGHFGRLRTFEAINRDFKWPNMREEIYKFVDSCIKCQKIKTVRGRDYGKLMPLPIATGPWKSISMDFIVKLPISEGFDSILVVVDRFSKMCHLIPCNERIDAPQAANLLLKNVFKHHGLPIDMVSDRGTQFTSKFWASICEQMGIQRKLSTAAHPQTDGQTERTNQTLEQYLRAFVNYKQDNWVNLLHFAEMAMNNAVSASTKRTPFEINLGYSPSFDYLARDKDLSVPAADIFMNGLKEIWIDTIKNLRETASRMKRNAENLRREHNFKVGDFVWLDTEHLRRSRPSGKLDYKRIGPYEVIECINKNAFRLRLPKGSRQHSVFNVSKLTPFVEPEAGTDEIEPDPDLVNGFEEFEVEAILDSRIDKVKKMYLVKWKGYSELHNSWEPEEHFENCQEILSEYLSKSGY